MEKRQRFTAEFKREAIRLMKTTAKPAATLARELDVPRNRLYKWSQDAEKQGPLKGTEAEVSPRFHAATSI